MGDVQQSATSTWTSISSPAASRRQDGARTLGRVDVHENPADADAAWAALEDSPGGSIYQSRRFLLPWLRTLGEAGGITPMIVVAHDARGEPVALLPLGVSRSGPARIAGFLGGADSNANLGLFKPGLDLSPADLESVLRAAAAKTRLKPDIFVLTNQPKKWDGVPNALDLFSSLPSASYCHGGVLDADPAVFLGIHQSKDAAKKLRKKQKRLEDSGALRFFIPRTAPDIARVLDAFFAQKVATFRQKNIHSAFETPEMRSFLERSCCYGPNGAPPAIELYALEHDGSVIATYGGGQHLGHLHLMFNSYDMDPEISRSSPGDLLLRMLLEQKCREGLRGFDLGVGEARYKNSWCDYSEPMFDSVLPITALGHASRIAEVARRAAKRWIKQSKWAWPLARMLMRRG